MDYVYVLYVNLVRQKKKRNQDTHPESNQGHGSNGRIFLYYLKGQL